MRNLWAAIRKGTASVLVAFSNPVVRIVLPEGATSGARVEIDGTSITIYDASNNIVTTLDTSGLIISDVDGSEIHIYDENPGSGTIIKMLPAARLGHTHVAGYIRAANNAIIDAAAMLLVSPKVDASDLSTIGISSGDSARGFGSRIDISASREIYLGNANAVPKPNLALETTQVTSTGPIYLDTAWAALTLINLWTPLGAPFAQPQYRKVASPANSVQVVGYGQNGTNATGTIIGSLPVGYRPLSTTRRPIWAFGGALNVTTEVPALTVLTNGDIELRGSVGATILGFDFTFPLDA